AAYALGELQAAAAPMGASPESTARRDGFRRVALARQSGPRRAHREGPEKAHAPARLRVRGPLPLATAAHANRGGQRARLRARKLRAPLQGGALSGDSFSSGAYDASSRRRVLAVPLGRTQLAS